MFGKLMFAEQDRADMLPGRQEAGITWGQRRGTSSQAAGQLSSVSDAESLPSTPR